MTEDIANCQLPIGVNSNEKSENEFKDLRPKAKGPKTNRQLAFGNRQ